MPDVVVRHLLWHPSIPNFRLTALRVLAADLEKPDITILRPAEVLVSRIRYLRAKNVALLDVCFNSKCEVVGDGLDCGDLLVGGRLQISHRLEPLVFERRRIRISHAAYGR